MGELGAALHAAYLRLDELLTDESHAGELRKLAGDGEQQQPGGRRCAQDAIHTWFVTAVGSCRLGLWC